MKKIARPKSKGQPGVLQAASTFFMDEASLVTIDKAGQPAFGQVWDTIPGNNSWQLGVVRNGRLLNREDSSIPVVPLNRRMGGVSFFASNSGFFRFGQGFKATMLSPEDSLFAITTSPGARPTFSPAMRTTFLGVTGEDRVGRGENALNPDSIPDGVMSIRIATGGRPFRITAMQLRASDERGTIIPPTAWDTIPGNGTWVLGVFEQRGNRLIQLNRPDGSINFTITRNTNLRLFFATPSDASFFQTFPLFKLTFSLGSSRFIDVGVPTDPGSITTNPGMSFRYVGMTEDRVRPGETPVGPDGQPDGEFRLDVL